MILNEALEEFCRQKLIDGVKKNSVHNYKATLSLFIGFLGSDLPVTAVSLAKVQDYIVSLLDCPISLATRSSYIRNIKVFMKWLTTEGYIDFPYSKIHIPRSPKKLVHMYSDDEIALILSRVQSSEEWIRRRNMAIIILMFDSGLRQAEVCSLRMYDVDFSTGIFTVYGKGDKMRRVRMGNFCISAIQYYLSECPFDNASYVFCGRRGEQLSTNAIRIFMYELQRELPFKLSSHKLRHNFATNYTIDQFNKTGTFDALSLQSLMGHSDLKTTQGYLQNARDLLVVSKEFSHVDGISRNLLEKAINGNYG